MRWQRTFRDQAQYALIGALLLIGAIGPTAPIHAQQRALYTTTDSALAPPTIIRAKRDYADRMTVPVHVGDAGPYQFLVDTGAERTVISRELAARLALVAGPSMTVQSIAGQAQVGTVNIPTISLSNKKFSLNNALALDAYNIGGDGVLGIDSLADQRVLFDFRHGTMHMSPSSGDDMASGQDTIIVRARRRHGRLVFTSAWVDGVRTAIVIDTGSEISLGNPALRRRLVRSRGALHTVGLQTATGEKITADIVSVDSLELDLMRLSGFALAFADANVFHALDLDRTPAILLGMDALRVFNSVAIDFPSRRIRFVLPRTGMNGAPEFASAR